MIAAPNHVAAERDRRMSERAETIATELDGLDLLALYNALAGRVRRATFPALVECEVTDDGETFDALRCPHCDTVVSEGGNLLVVDDSTRYTGCEDASMDSRELSFWHDDTADYDHLHYACNGCKEAVSLPDGWTER